MTQRPRFRPDRVPRYDLHLRLEKNLAEAVFEKANRERRSVSDTIRAVLEDAVQREPVTS